MYIPQHLVWDPIMRVWLVEEAFKAFYLLQRQMQCEGMTAPNIISGYRSYALQKKCYENALKEKGYRRYATLESLKCKRDVVAPGTSEHQLGTAVDLLFHKKTESEWFREHAKQYGFILRYPEDKTHLTGRPYEEGHYRYIGIGHAKKMAKLSLCLEEYNNLYGDGQHINGG